MLLIEKNQTAWTSFNRNWKT